MENFLKLSIEKQDKITDGALKVFALHGYKKASVSDIAKESGISKAMVFHYFGTKKDLYLYLLNTCVESIVNEVVNKFDESETDFFNRILSTSKLKINLIKKHPDVPTFLQSAYFEEADAVKEEIRVIFSKDDGKTAGKQLTLDGADFSKFKEDVDPALVMTMVEWLSEGYMNKVSDAGAEYSDQLFETFEESLMLLKKNLYK